MTKLDGRTHHPQCWESHHDCAKRAIDDMLDVLDDIYHGIDDPKEAAKRMLLEHSATWDPDAKADVLEDPNADSWLLDLRHGDTVTAFFDDGAFVTGEITDIGEDSLGIEQDRGVYTVVPRSPHVMMIRRVEDDDN